MQSMTGYGSAAGKVGRGRFYIEIKTLNHRYCEIAFKIPPRMGSLENPLREFLQRELQRGRVELFLKEVESVFGPIDLALNLDLAKQYQKALLRLQKALKIPGKLNILSLTNLDHFVQPKEREENYSHYLREIERLVQRALSQAQKMRAKEGRFLLRDQKKRLREFATYLKKIDVLGAQALKNREVVDITSFNNKTDISEERTRLKSHAKQYEDVLSSKEPIGRKLDFLIQEMHRELNTIGAKAAHAKISQYIVESKSILESLREQVQNIL